MSILNRFSEGQFTIKARAKGYFHTLTCIVKGNKLQLHFPYNEHLLAEVKETFESRRWVPEKTCWEIPITQRNIFRLEVLQGKYSTVKPYEQYDRLKQVNFREQIAQHCSTRKDFRGSPIAIYNHQADMVNQAIIAKWFVWAAEMGTGKTLAAIIAMELAKQHLGIDEWFWVGPRSALIAVRLDFEKWATSIRPSFYTYEAVRELVDKWPVGRPAPQGLILDEASRVKNPQAKRTQAVKHLADSMRGDHGMDCMIGLLSGTPAPKSPIDWWSLCEIACPGYVREGHINAFKQRLAIIEKRETVPGAGAYDHIVAWKSSDLICALCGKPDQHVNHTSDPTERFKLSLRPDQNQTHEAHSFEACDNAVAKLAKSLEGLVMVKLKSECTDLPAKRYEVIKIKPSRQTLNMAKLVVSRARRSNEANILLRELSDGFQYSDVGTGKFKECPNCGGIGKSVKYVNAADVSHSLTDDEVRDKCRFLWSQPNPEDDPDYFVPEIIGRVPIEIKEESQTCEKCDGNKQIEVMERKTVEVECPKDQVITDLLERHEECGRLVLYGGFTGTIERICRICLSKKWAVVKADGHGWEGWTADGFPMDLPGSKDEKSQELVRLFMYGQEEYPFMVFVGQPGAAGMGLTLTASPTIVFVSNDFNGESRWQAEDRGHRLGMDLERGGLIIDIIHLPTDELVIQNLQAKKDLQYMSMKGLQKCLEQSA